VKMFGADLSLERLCSARVVMVQNLRSQNVWGWNCIYRNTVDCSAVTAAYKLSVKH